MADDTKNERPFPKEAIVVDAGVTLVILSKSATIWRRQNVEAISDYNAMVEKDGISLSEYRKF